MLDNSKYVSTMRILEGVARDAAYDNVSIGDALEWLWEVIEYLNIPLYYVDDIVYIDVEDYRGRMPENFQKLVQVRDYVTKTPLLESKYLFFKSPNKTPLDQIQAIVNVEGGSVEYSTSQQSASTRYDQYTYKIEEGWIYTEYSTTKIEMAYKAFPIDENGFPKVPEDAKFLRALKAFIIMKLDYLGWRKGLISEAIYRNSEQDYYYAAASAQSKANMPNLEMMEAMRRQSSLLVSDPTQYLKSFKYINR